MTNSNSKNWSGRSGRSRMTMGRRRRETEGGGAGRLGGREEGVSGLGEVPWRQLDPQVRPAIPLRPPALALATSRPRPILRHSRDPPRSPIYPP